MAVITDEERLNRGNRPDDYYKCSCCGRVVGRENLRVKRVVFKTLGAQGQTLKSTTSAWLCVIPQSDGSPSCLSRDEDWQAPSMRGTPGARGTILEA